ncbi:PAS domain S-box protein [Polaromonas sp. P1(28)-13]|nr:PAS domain S-box protein [Polaromonas sp. P1(28)-13]
MDADFITSTLNIFAARASAELERQRADALIQRRAALLDLAQEAILVRDLDQRIEYWNAGAARMYGWTSEEVLGRSIAELLYEDDREFQSATEQVKTTGHWRGDLQQRRKDGSVLWVEGHWTLVRDAAGPAGILFAINADITVRRAVQRELQQLNVELDDRVQRRTAELEAVNRDLESFSYSVSHDLRSPLSTIAGFSQLLAKTDGDKISEKGKHYLDRIRTGARTISELIEGLLSLAQLSRQPVDMQDVDLSQLARQVEQACREREPDRQVQMHIQDGLSVRGDPRLILAVMQNLLGNAWKFSARQLQARIDVGCDTSADGQPRYFVKDNGAGFDMAHAKRLLELSSDFIRKQSSRARGSGCPRFNG